MFRVRQQRPGKLLARVHSTGWRDFLIFHNFLLNKVNGSESAGQLQLSKTLQESANESAKELAKKKANK
jgi:hypothetical protein